MKKYSTMHGAIDIKKATAISAVIFVLLLAISSVHAEDANETDSQNAEIIPDTKTFTDLSNEIENAGSTVTLKGTYKYYDTIDEAHEKGVRISKDITITGEGDCTIDGNKQSRCIKIDPGCKVTIKGITFKNGFSKNSPGGAIFAGRNSNLKIYDCVFTNNVAYNSNGGAIATSYYTHLEIHSSKFLNNKATGTNSKTGMGGAIEVNLGSKLILDNCLFKKNKARLSIILLISHSKKMGIHTSKAYVKNCMFEKNTADINGVFYLDEYGWGKFTNNIFKYNVAKKGGILILDASKYALIKNCRFLKNTAIFGGAIKLVKHKKSIAHVSVTACQFYKNIAKNAGGAIFSESGKLTIKKSRFTQNRATKSGGAVEIRKGTLKLSRNVFKKNKSRYGGAILVKDKKSIYLYKTKFIKNTAKKGKKILAIYHHMLSELKNKYGKKKLIKITSTKKNERKLIFKIP